MVNPLIDPRSNGGIICRQSDTEVRLGRALAGDAGTRFFANANEEHDDASKLMLWGAAAAIALGSTARLANVVVVKSLGPSSKAYPPGKTLPESAKITFRAATSSPCSGRQRADPARPGQFRRQAGRAGVGRRPARPLRRAARRRSRAQPEHLGHRRQPERQDLRQPMRRSCSCGGPTAKPRRRSRSARPTARPSDSELGRGQGAGRLAGRAPDQQRRELPGRVARHRREEQPRLRHRSSAPPTISSAPRRC